MAVVLNPANVQGQTAADLFNPDAVQEIRLRGTGSRNSIKLGLRVDFDRYTSSQTFNMRVTDERRGQSVDDTDLSPAVAAGWYVSGTWAVTGEAKAKGLDAPPRPFFRGGPGVIEVAARWSV